jgi:hypothetical protein
MKRIFLFIVTNLAVLALLTVVIFVIEQVFGVRRLFMSHPPLDERIAALTS